MAKGVRAGRRMAGAELRPRVCPWPDTRCARGVRRATVALQPIVTAFDPDTRAAVARLHHGDGRTPPISPVCVETACGRQGGAYTGDVLGMRARSFDGSPDILRRRLRR